MDGDVISLPTSPATYYHALATIIISYSGTVRPSKILSMSHTDLVVEYFSQQQTVTNTKVATREWTSAIKS